MHAKAHPFFELKADNKIFLFWGKHALKKARAQQIIRKPSDVKNQLEVRMFKDIICKLIFVSSGHDARK